MSLEHLEPPDTKIFMNGSNCMQIVCKLCNWENKLMILKIKFKGFFSHNFDIFLCCRFTTLVKDSRHA